VPGVFDQLDSTAVPELSYSLCLLSNAVYGWGVAGNGNESDPRRVFGRALKHLRTRAGLSPDQIGRATYVSADMIAKIEIGKRSPSDKLIQACEELPELRSDGILTELWDELRDHVSQGYPTWFAEWPVLETRCHRRSRWATRSVHGGRPQGRNVSRVYR
jgi:transcriptional regulator with XRE-family HTH domain